MRLVRSARRGESGSIATIVVAKWEKAFDTDQAARVLGWQKMTTGGGGYAPTRRVPRRSELTSFCHEDLTPMPVALVRRV